MASSVDICNDALVLCGAERITALSENNKRAKLCNEHYERMRDRALRSHPWNFNTFRVSSSSLVTTPVFGFEYEHQKPSDCLRVLFVSDTQIPTSGPDQDPITYHVERDKILADYATIYVKYLAKVTDVSKFDENFKQCLAHDIAYHIVYALVQSVTLKKEINEERQRLWREARSFDAQEGTPLSLEANEWLDSRLG